MKTTRPILLVFILALSFSFLSVFVVNAINNQSLNQATTVANWVDTVRNNDVGYFLFDDPIKLERYDIGTESWLDPIAFNSLLGEPTAVSVDDSYIFVAFGQAVYRFDLDGTNQLHLYNTNSTVKSLFTNDSHLIINHSSGSNGRLATVEKATGLFVDSRSYTYRSLNGASYSPEVGKIFGRTSGISPSDILYVQVNSDGTLGTGAIDSPYHGGYPNASATFLFPEGGRVVDTSGIVYNTSDLSYSNSLAGGVNDIDFYGELPIVLRGGTLLSFSNTLLETGSYTPTDHTPAKIYIKNQNVFSFYYEETRGVAVAKIDIDLLSPDAPGDAVDPYGLKYSMDSLAIGTGEIIYILSKSQLSIFRWSVDTRRYLESIPLASAPTYMAYSPVTNRIYLAYSSGEMTQIKLDESFAEVPFANLPSSPSGLATAGEFVFASDPSGAWASHYTYAPDGTQISAVDWNYVSDEYVWSEANRKMYFFRDHTSPNDLLWEEIDVNGAIGTKQDSPYHSSEGIVHPISVAPDGSKVVLGSGRIYDGISLSLLESLPNSIEGAAWLGDSLYTLRDIGVDTQVQRWGPTNGLEDAAVTPGEAVKVYAVDEGLLVIMNFYGLPRFILYDADFNVLFESITMFGLEAFAESPIEVGNSATFTSSLAFESGNLSYLWAFGDGALQSGSTTSHVYSAIGEYDVTLTVMNEAETISTTTAVSVVDAPISGLIAFNDSPTEQFSPTQLSAQVSQGTNVSYSWDLGDGTYLNGSIVEHVYPNIGSYTATVTATNSTNYQVMTTQVTVTELVTPLIEFAPESLTFTVNAGNESPVEKVISITNGGTGSFDWYVNENINWLTVNKVSGTAPDNVTVSASWSNLPVGTYTGQIELSSNQADNSPQSVPVTMHVLPAVTFDLAVESGYTAVELNWDVVANPNLDAYAVYRSVDGTNNWSEIAQTNATTYFDEASDLAPGQSYCYYVSVIDSDGHQLVKSTEECVVFGGTSLWIPNVMASPGSTAVVPVNINNAQGLEIAAADIWLEYDSSVLTFQSVSATPLTNGYIWSYEDELVSGNIRRIKIGTFSLSHRPLYGEGSLFWLKFHVVGNPLAQSELDLKEFVSNVGGSTIYTPDNLDTPISLILNDGLFTVEDGYTLGDLNGNGVVETVDAYLALRIAVRKVAPTPEQVSAGDVNGNGRIDVADATMIFYYAVHGEWPTLNRASRFASLNSAVNLSIQDVTASDDETVLLTLHADNLVDWAGGQFAIVYDPIIIESIIAVNGTDLAESFLIETNENEEGLIQIAMMSNQSVSGSGDILTIELGLKDDLPNGLNSPINIGSVELNDLVGRDFATSALQVDIETNGGTIKTADKYTIYMPILIRP